ncbi:hypothetical protein AgCh_040063 [Apium graveolens]
MAASTSYNKISSSSTSPPTLWDVFLSFRGTDTRYTFTDHLYKALDRTGIRTFMDNPELRSGEVISDSLIQAITESKTCIVVLSENYASSPWCLDELAEILNCYKTMNRLVIPVFYNIHPSVVRHQIGSFKEAFDKHQTRFEMEKVNRWRLTLSEVAHFSGYDISQNRSQAEIIDEVVDRVLQVINPKTLNVAKYPVGLDSRVKSVTTLFNSDTKGVTRIGIHGMGGVGKTTLAKALYNQHYRRFQGSSFLANVREVSEMTNGLVSLQRQLIADVLERNINICNVDQGIELIRARICSKKVLIVIDDLDNPEPLRYIEGSFASGSMVIVTTRNEDLLDSIKVKAKYMVDKMGEDESRQLLTQHAFGDNKIPEAFIELSKVILEHAGGLPLALQVFGSTLLNQSEEGWRWFINKLKRVPIEDVEKKLMISFDALKSIDPMLQDIFLDISCFYIGWPKEEAIRIMETCYTFVNCNIDILKKRCLIIITEKNELEMHDLIRNMGRGITHNNSPDEPGKHSRLWKLNDIHRVLKKDKGTEAIQGIISNYADKVLEDAPEVSFSAEAFKRMSKLRFLYLNKVTLTGSFEKTFEDLRWFCWKHCPLKCLPSEFFAQKLVILELPHSKLTMWKLNKALNMSESQKLTTTPDFTKLPSLETINFKGCGSLKEVHKSVGSLARLVSLNLEGCRNLRRLPDSVCTLRALKVLNIGGCSRIKPLPTDMGNIESLEVFVAGELILGKLPESIGRLSNLVYMSLSQNKNLKTLPDISGLPNIASLNLRGCTSMKRLPDLSNLKQLESLDLEDCRTLTFIQGLEELNSLKYINLDNCRHLLSVTALPPMLQTLWANDCRRLLSMPELPPNLKELYANGCRCLLSMPELPPNLKELYASGCVSMESLPDLSNLQRLKRLNLESCSALTDIIGLEELVSLKDLTLTGCNSSLLANTLTRTTLQMLSRSTRRVKIALPPKQYPDWISEISKTEASSYDRTGFYAGLGGIGMIFSARLGAILSVENSVIISTNKSAFFHGYDTHLVVYGNSMRQ